MVVEGHPTFGGSAAPEGCRFATRNARHIAPGVAAKLAALGTGCRRRPPSSGGRQMAPEEIGCQPRDLVKGTRLLEQMARARHDL